MELRSSIWPFDIISDPQPPARQSPNELRCFLISPFTPKERFDDLFGLVISACNEVAKQLGCNISCIRADKISGSGVIQPEIWHEIRTADVIVADVTGLNGNVMIELGVASACRKKEHVIILKEQNSQEQFLFDISPVRHIVYNRTATGFQHLYEDLLSSILVSLTSAPFEIAPNVPIPSLPLKVDFDKGRDVNWLIGPSLTHRRLLSDCLEFGSLFVFKNSWLAVANLEVSKVTVEAEMKFTLTRETEGWIGINVRSHHYFANYGHLLYLTTTGKVIRTVPKGDLSLPENDLIGTFADIELTRQRTFRIEVDDNSMMMFIDDIGKEFKLADMPYVFPSGKVLFQTYNARVGIKSISIEHK